jgi:hypothetical protein
LFENIQNEITMNLDHKNLQYFMTTHVLNWHQAQWVLTLFQFDLSSYIVLGTNKGNLMHCPIACTSHLRKEMQPIINMWCHFQAWTFFILGVVGNSWWHNPFLSNSWRFEKPFHY